MCSKINHRFWVIKWNKASSKTFTINLDTDLKDAFYKCYKGCSIQNWSQSAWLKIPPLVVQSQFALAANSYIMQYAACSQQPTCMVKDLIGWKLSYIVHKTLSYFKIIEVSISCCCLTEDPTREKFLPLGDNYADVLTAVRRGSQEETSKGMAWNTLGFHAKLKTKGYCLE